jgi:hypothetical protein
MRVVFALTCIAWTLAFAQNDDPPEVLRAKQEIEQVRARVEQGALPASRLQEAQQALEDVQDELILRRILYNSVSVEDLTEEQAEEMVAAARRRVERYKTKVERAKKLIEEAVASRLSLGPFLEEADRRQRSLDLATSRARLVSQIAAIARVEQIFESRLESSPQETSQLAEKFDGTGIFHIEQLSTISLAFEAQFTKSLPISARGDTAVHRALGFDHRGRVDVALDPDQPEGVWLRRFLRDAGIPYFAFRSFIPGKSTAPHIHIGPPSDRIREGSE